MTYPKMGYRNRRFYFALVSFSAAKREHRAIAQLVRQHREGTGLTQEQLAKKLGKPQSFVSKVENGDRVLDIPELRSICHALDITFVQFINELDALLNASK